MAVLRIDMSSTLTWPRSTVSQPGWTLTVPDRLSPRAVTEERGELGDAELVAACLGSDPGAFDVIVRRHQRAVYRLCYRFVPNHEDASDLSQEVFLKAFRALRSFRGHSSLGTWLYRISVNVCLNRVSVKAPRFEPIDDQAPIQTQADSPADQVLSQERAARMRALVARLPNKQRTALVLRVYQGMSHQQVADVLGITVGAVKANVFHGLKNLKRLMSAEGAEGAGRDEWR